MPMSGGFDASQIKPKQPGESHPVGKFPFTITNTSIAATKDEKGGNFIVEFTTPVGTTMKWYNLWPSPEGKDPAMTKTIADGQLSALCHATGVFKLDWQNDGAVLRGSKGMMEVGYQKGQEPSPELPFGGYTEIKRVYDAAGNEPGKAPSMQQAAPQQQAFTAPQQQPPMQQQPNGGWGAPQPQTQPQAQPNPAPGWQAPQQQAAPTANPAPQGWTQQAAGAAPPPPWAKQ